MFYLNLHVLVANVLSFFLSAGTCTVLRPRGGGSVLPCSMKNAFISPNPRKKIPQLPESPNS